MKYEYWFASIKNLSGRKKLQLHNKYKSAKALYYIEETELKRCGFLEINDIERIKSSVKNWDLEERYDRFCERGCQLILAFQAHYPKRLKETYNHPYALFVKGGIPAADRPAIAIVGARRCTPYGEQMAREIAGQLAELGIDIISGMALGIDGAAARGALDSNGLSYAVLGCGADICYPREHLGLYLDLQKSGGIISEQPVGEPPLKQYFPARNRIISALSDLVIVVEARERSGSLITVDFALEQGKEVYAVPGPINSELSKGCNSLLKQGAGVFISVEELLSEFEINYERNVKKTIKSKIKLESVEKLVYSCLDLFPKNMETIIRETKVPAAALMGVLVSLELRGIVEEISKNHYIKKK